MGAPRNMVVGVFDTRDRAERAVAELHIAGYRDDQISTAAPVVAWNRPPGERVARPLEAAGAAADKAKLVSLGISEEDARYYEEEVAAGRFVVAVNCTGNATDGARTAISRNCGYGRIPPHLR